MRILFAAAVAAAFATNAPQVRDIDGDTLVIDGEIVRIAGINAADPVTGRACTARHRWRYAWCNDDAAASGTTFAREWLAAHRGVVALVRYGCDRHDRTVADVRFGNDDFGNAMVASGLAHRVPTTAIRCRH